MKKAILNYILLLLMLSAACVNDNYLAKYRERNSQYGFFNDKLSDKDQFYAKNYANVKNFFPFYIIRLKAPLFSEKPGKNFSLFSDNIELKYGDVVFPAKGRISDMDFFYVRTIDNKYGWVYTGCGISINHQEDESLYYFDGRHYLKKYIETNGKADNSSLIVLAKNIVPLLLDNYSTEGWFYPADYQLAFDISSLCTLLAEDKKTHVESATVLFDWTVSEYLVAYNLFADSCQKLGYLEKAEEIHKDLIKRHFWKNYDNSKVGGLNSVVKLEMIYIDMMKKVPVKSYDYNAVQDKLIENILIIGNTYNIDTIIDKKWRLTGAEWVLEILRTSLSPAEFFDTADKLNSASLSEGYKDMIALYAALVKYHNGSQDDAMKMFENLKKKNSDYIRLKVNDWLSENKIVPDSLIYQYDF